MSESRSKATFYRALEDLDDPDETSDDEDSLERLLTRCVPAKSSERRGHISPRVHQLSLTRANTAPLPLETSEKISGGDHARNSTYRQQDASSEIGLRTITRTQTTSAMPSITKIAKRGERPASKKQRTNSVIKFVPEEQRIFKNLVIFFFPNNDISPSRRLRIQRAREFGAHWVTEWVNSITHVVIDKDLTCSDLMKFLGLESLPDKVVLVNETYPPECIRFRSVLCPMQNRFQVEGGPGSKPQDASTAELPNSTEQEQSSSGSLALKAPRKEKQQTPEPARSQLLERVEDSRQSLKVVAGPNAGLKSIEGESACQTDALDDLLAAARSTSRLALDLMESTDDEASESEREADPRALHYSHEPEATTAVPSNDKWARSFACMQKCTTGSKIESPNKRTLEALQQMLDYYSRTGDHWRTLAYRKAINALQGQSKKVTSARQALLIPGIGARLADKIEEIVLTDHLRRLDNAHESKEDKILQQFLGIYGCGIAQASKWVAQGYRSLAELRERAPLTTNQLIGIERYDDFAQRVPRKEVEAHAAVVQQAARSVDNRLQVIIGGSYRRGAPDSGDIDLLITDPQATLTQIRSVVLDSVVPMLFESGFLQVGLQTSRQNGHGSKWQGASKLPGSQVWRRLDLLFVPGAEFGAALLYFTGNDLFNRSMRLLARKKGMCLNQRGLFKGVLRNGQVKVNNGRLLEGRDERRIFEILGVPWRWPEQRSC